MRTRTLGIILITLILVAALPVTAQEGDDSPMLTVISADAAHPVQFQALAPGDAPVSSAFVSTLDVPPDPDQSLIYVILQNTGWSQGGIGLSSAALDPDEDYIAVEVDAEGAPHDGGLAFPLVFDAESGQWWLDVLIAQMCTLAIFRVDADGGPFEGVTNVREGNTVTQDAVEILLDPEPVFGAVVLDLHIVAIEIPPPSEEPDKAPATTGTWGPCGSCDTCGYPVSECITTPDGGCVWDYASCRALPGPAAASAPPDSSGACVPSGCYHHFVYGDMPPDEMCGPPPPEASNPECDCWMAKAPSYTAYDNCGNVCETHPGFCSWMCVCDVG